MKRLLIISPYFPPSNTADMQRVRMSLPYFKEFGWEAEVVTVDDRYADVVKDEMLVQSLPVNIKVHKVKALNKAWTAKLGLGSLALRSLLFYRQKVNNLLKKSQYDLIYFSTTAFPVCILGAYWKKRFGIPYVIDIQDPWHSDYYLDKPKHQQPPKYWFSYRLNKYLEPIALKQTDGLISVSEAYIIDLKERYPEIANIPAATITFGAFAPDLEIAKQNSHPYSCLLDEGTANIVYIGRGGADMHPAVIPVFEALQRYPLPDQLKLYFIGTSYAPAGKGQQTIMPLAKQYGLDKQVIEITDRISYYHTLITLQQAHALFIPGSDDPKYTASKIYPYLLTHKPILAIFNKQSPALATLREYGVEQVYNYEEVTQEAITGFFNRVIQNNVLTETYHPEAIEKYSARQMTFRQCQLFDEVLHNTGPNA